MKTQKFFSFTAENKPRREELLQEGWTISMITSAQGTVYGVLDPPPPPVSDKIYTHDQLIAAVVSFAIWANDRDLSGRTLHTEAEMYFKFTKP